MQLPFEIKLIARRAGASFVPACGRSISGPNRASPISLDLNKARREDPSRSRFETSYPTNLAPRLFGNPDLNPRQCTHRRQGGESPEARASTADPLLHLIMKLSITRVNSAWDADTSITAFVQPFGALQDEHAPLPLKHPGDRPPGKSGQRGNLSHGVNRLRHSACPAEQTAAPIPHHPGPASRPGRAGRTAQLSATRGHLWTSPSPKSSAPQAH